MTLLSDRPSIFKRFARWLFVNGSLVGGWICLFAGMIYIQRVAPKSGDIEINALVALITCVAFGLGWKIDRIKIPAPKNQAGSILLKVFGVLGLIIFILLVMDTVYSDWLGTIIYPWASGTFFRQSNENPVQATG